MPVLLVLKDFFMEFADFVLPHLVEFWQNSLMPLWSEFVLTMETGTVFPMLYMSCGISGWPCSVDTEAVHYAVHEDHLSSLLSRYMANLCRLSCG